VPDGIGQTVLACEGVRHGLAIIFELLAAAGCRVALPKDVYPVYWHLASDAKLQTTSFETFVDFDIAAILDNLRRLGAHVLLLPYPLKLHGRRWTESEIALVENWLREIPERRLLVDGVYSLGLPMDAATKRLIATDQVIYLDSLSKGWLFERVFGVAIVPRRDELTYTNRFRTERPTQPNLLLAQELLSQFHDFPSRLAAEIDESRSALLKRLVAATTSRILTTDRGYFVAVEASAADLLSEHSIIAIPASTFGSNLHDWSIASALPRAAAL
jgi:aspartate/methionine/tyrosine aminotransferase